MFGALKDLRVIELGQLIAGPFCGQLMADHGAEVIKIEQPGDGDPMRNWGRTKSLWWEVVGRNKKSVTINLRIPEGQNLVKQLVEKSDFLLENFRPGTMERWGLGWEDLKAVNPKLIMIRVSGYGQTGPYAHRAGYGGIGEAMGGLRNLVGDPSTPPSRVGISLGDSLAGTLACLGAMMALHHREKTGEGQMIDSAIYEAVLAMMESLVPEYTETGFVRERTGSILPKIAPSNVYPTRDGSLLIGANQDSVFRRLCEAMGRPELAKVPKYVSHDARGKNQQELDNLIGEWTSTLSTAELSGLMEKHGVPSGKIYKAADMLEDPQYKAREALIKVDHERYKNLVMQNVFPRLSKTPGKVSTKAPELGQHNTEIFRELLGLGKDDIDRLRKQGAI
ncbi:MAG: CoA transferase [Proteobacteria bacterium]|nr:CoA transferase [Pseudomonadota bacterium]MCH8321605.1 CoA transferase [Pseudomonadota bacterium]